MRKVDVRVVSATHRDLEQLVDSGQFRQDLFYRLHGLAIALPPLRRRRSGIMPLAKYFLERSQSSSTLTVGAEAALAGHSWPGNVRELKNVVERASLLARGGPIEARHIVFSAGAPAEPRPRLTAAPSAPEAVRSAPSLHGRRWRPRENLWRLGAAGWNRKRAAELLGMSRNTLLKRLDEYGVARVKK